jgi:hypothetical protein
VLSLQPKNVTSGDAKTTDEKVYEMIPTLLEMLPDRIDMDDINQ